MKHFLRQLICFWLFTLITVAQPELTPEGVRFHLNYPDAKTVTVAGDFNGWSTFQNQLVETESRTWSTIVRLQPGIYQYLFIVNDSLWVLDPQNPIRVENYNQTGFNSVITVTESRKLLFIHNPTFRDVYDQSGTASSMKDKYPTTGGTLFLNIIWHQHQPSYINPVKDHLVGPWVRTHGTKDYYDMTAMLRDYPDVHVTVNLTSSLLYQLDNYYVQRLRPYYNKVKNRIDTNRYFKEAAGTIDPWIDLALKPTAEFTDEHRNYLYRNPWNCFGISEVQIGRFPEYEKLKNYFTKEYRAGRENFTEQQMREVKFWFYLAHFDPDFLEGPVALPDGSICDLSDIIEKRDDGKYYLRRKVTEDDCNRIVAETFKVLSNVIPIHKEMLYNPKTGKGQVEVITTPFYHPILPLIYDSDLTKISQPRDPLPSRFHYPDDARAQVAKAIKFYRDIFDAEPFGMWPAEGAVAQDVVKIFQEHGIKWIATDQRILRNSKPKGLPHHFAYRVFADSLTKKDEESIAIVFRDTELSDRIGFVYQNFTGEDATDDFIRRILEFQPQKDESPRLLTVILDGENAWEWYRYDNDGKEFLNTLYRKLSALYDTGQVITVTMSEYLYGNPARGIPANSLPTLKKIHWLHPGSWINANYNTWIGEEEENIAWELLLLARRDLEKLRIPRPDPLKSKPKSGTKEWFEYMAWESMYAAQGSDWFWWFGDDQIAPGGEEPWDEGFRTHLTNMYKFAQKAGYDVEVPDFPSVLVPKEKRAARPVEHIGTMARSSEDLIRVIFIVDARHLKVNDAIYIVGNLPELGQWNPNVIKMFDDGTNGDEVAGDGIWSIAIDLPRGSDVRYKYTNSGLPGEWIPSEEFPVANRELYVDGGEEDVIIVRDVYGDIVNRY